MKKYLAPAALILALAVVAALAQNITKSVQLSQDPTGLVGYDTSNNVYFPAHILSNTRGGPAPTLNTCGTTSTILGTDTQGKVTTGSVITTCNVAFGTVYVTAPACVVSAQGTATQPTFTTTVSQIIMTVDIALTTYNYICMSTS